MKGGKSARRWASGEVGRGSGINYETCAMSPKAEFKAHFGSRYDDKYDVHWLDGKVTLVGYLIERMRSEKAAKLSTPPS